MRDKKSKKKIKTPEQRKKEKDEIYIKSALSIKTSRSIWRESRANLYMNKIMNYISFWASEIKNEENMKFWIRPNTPLTMLQACREMGRTAQWFYKMINQFPDVKNKYKELREWRRQFLQETAETNIQNGITWWMDLTDKELIDASFKLLEKTDKAYNPKTEIETKQATINLDVTDSELQKEIINILWSQNNT